MRIHNIQPQDLLKETANILNKKLGPVPFLLMLSGGSSLALLDYINTDLLGKQVTISVLDDRYSIDPKENNFLQIHITVFYKIVVANGAQFIDTSLKENESLQEYGIRFESNLKKWRVENPNAPIIATVGVGPDGHVAGIMPYPEDPDLFTKIFENTTWTVGYEALDSKGQKKNTFSLRLTPTMTFIRNNITTVISYVTGENKKSALDKVIAEDGTLSETPARILREIPDVTICTDLLC